MTFEQELAEHGFEVLQQRRDGSRQYARRANRYLSYWLTVQPGGAAELTWEFELGQYLRDRGLSVSGQDELSLLLFPGREIRGQVQDGWVGRALEEAETTLRSLDFVAGT